MTHQPVLLQETINHLLGDPDGLYIDCTLGGGGHLRELIPHLSEKAKIVAIDRDMTVLSQVKNSLSHPGIRFVHADFRQLQDVLYPEEFGNVEGIMIDLGVSSFQLDTPERGFSFHEDSALDMRMDKSQELNAWDIVNTYSETEIADIIYKYGEERYSRRIARGIVEKRQQKDVNTTLELVEIIKQAVPGKYKKDKHPARKTFQALRIAVNDELGAIEQVLPQAIKVLKPGGRLCIITFHSLEDRMIKNYFREKSRDCICPPKMPVCICGGNRAEIKIENRKPIIPSEEECLVNKRARSAKLRVARKS